MSKFITLSDDPQLVTYGATSIAPLQSETFNGNYPSDSRINYPVNDNLRLYAQTVMTGIIIVGSGPSTYTYMMHDSLDQYAVRNTVEWLYVWNSGSPYLEMVCSSSGVDEGPWRDSATNAITPNVYMDVAGTWNGGLTATGIHLYAGIAGSPIKELSYGPSFDGVGAPQSAHGLITIGNRIDGSRTTNGSIFYTARWNRVLLVEEMRLVQRWSPLIIPDGLKFCRMNGRDYGPYGLIPTLSQNVTKGPFNVYTPMTLTQPSREINIYSPLTAAQILATRRRSYSMFVG